MRGVLFGVALSVVAQGAYAADLSAPYLRGSQYEAIPAAKWSGWYAGLHAGASFANGDLANAPSSLIADILTNTLIEQENQVSGWTPLGRHSKTGISYGAFVGYNTVWEDAVVGVEFTYNRTNLDFAATDSIARSVATSDDFLHAVNVSVSAETKLTDFATARLRGGWAFGDWMPYMVAGVAVGRGNIYRSATVSSVGDHATLPDQVLPPTTRTESKTAYSVGYVLGVGFDYEIARDFFVRGEYEFVHFLDFQNTQITINTARIAAGVRF